MRNGVKLNFILERKDHKQFLQSWKWLPQPLLSGVAALPLHQQHLPPACAVLMGLGMEKGEFTPGKDLAACFPQTWSEVCQGGQGRDRVPSFPSLASTGGGIFLLFLCCAVWSPWSGREGDEPSPPGPCSHSDLQEVPQESVPLTAPCKSCWGCSVRGIQVGKDLAGHGSHGCAVILCCELTPASHSCSSAVVVSSGSQAGRCCLGCSQDCILQGLLNRAGAAGQALPYPLGSSF